MTICRPEDQFRGKNLSHTLEYRLYWALKISLSSLIHIGIYLGQTYSIHLNLLRPFIGFVLTLKSVSITI